MNQLSAFQSIHNILTLSSQGINFTSAEVCGQVFKSLKKIYSLNGLERITSLYHLLHFLGNTPSAQTMTNNQHFFNSNSPNDIVDKIYKYLINNFQNEIHLNDLAQIVNLRTSTLCMYFKRHTLKSIFETLNEIRISHSCKLLTNTRFNIKQIAMEAGFNNVAYFNRQFLRLKKQSPGAYRKNQKDYLPE
jgi:AraC-like DNA-binding protein